MMMISMLEGEINLQAAQAAGKNLANPVAQILSAAMLLEHFGLNEEGALIRKAVDASLDAYLQYMKTPSELQTPASHFPAVLLYAFYKTLLLHRVLLAYPPVFPLPYGFLLQ